MLQPETDPSRACGVRRKCRKLSIIKLEKCLDALSEPSYSSYLWVLINYGLHFLEKLAVQSALTHPDTVGRRCDGRGEFLEFRDYRGSAQFVVFALFNRVDD